MTLTTPTRPHAPTRPTALVEPNPHTAASPDWTYHARAARHHAAPATRPGATRLFVDLTSPWAYLAHLRLTGDDGPTWVAVQPPVTIPRTGLRGNGPARERARFELEAVRALAGPDEELPTSEPAVIPHPRTVAAAYAEAVDLGLGDEVRSTLLEAYWVEGKDIGDPEVLRRILPPVVVAEGALCTGDPRREWGYLVSPAREPLTDPAYHLMAGWQRDWVELGRPEPLALVAPDGSLRSGPAALLA